MVIFQVTRNITNIIVHKIDKECIRVFIYVLLIYFCLFESQIESVHPLYCTKYSRLSA